MAAPHGFDIESLFSPRGRTVLISGGAKGIGKMIACIFAVNGAHVIMCGRDAAAGKLAAAEIDALVRKSGELSAGIGAHPPKNKAARFIAADLAKEEDCKNVIKDIAEREGVLDVLVNNAGANWGEDYETFPEKAWDRCLNLNVRSIFSLTRAATPLLESTAEAREASMAEQSPPRPRRSSVINIGSIDGIRVPALETYAYSASKAAVHHLTKVLANKLASRSITVNAIAAGAFDTKMMKATLDQFKEQIEAGIPLGRIGTPADIGAVCLWLAGDGGSWVTGAVIPVEGGVLIGAKY